MTGLAEMVEQLVDAAVDAIAEDNDVGAESVVRGDRARPMPPLPSVWVVPETATCQIGEYGEAEAWTLPLSIAALVHSEDPEEGGRLCAEMAAKARRAVLRNRLHDVEGVTDTVSTQFNATARSSERNRNLFWADAQVSVTFTVEEEEGGSS